MITIQITNGTSYEVAYFEGMNVQQALEAAYNQAAPQTFTYALVYFGSTYGYLVSMINETYETYNSKEQPFYFWEFLVNGNIAASGIDNTILNDGDTVNFEFTVYNPNTHQDSTTHVKFKGKR